MLRQDYWTEDDYEQVMKKRVRGGVEGHARRSTVNTGIPEPPRERSQGDECGPSAPHRDRLHRTVHPSDGSKPVSSPVPSPYKSKLEAAWALKLAGEKWAGHILAWWYEPLNFRLPGMKNFYKPDFLVEENWLVKNYPLTVRLTFYEVKGWSQSNDRSLVKMKTAAGLTPWARFMLVKWINGAWVEREIV